MKKLQVVEFVERKKPHILSICGVKRNNLSKRTKPDYIIPGYSLHPINLDSNIGEGELIYTHSSIENCVI